MSSRASRHPRLRAKTGCLTCKKRRKKCDEKYPACSRCTISGRPCQWPTAEELTDRRWASHRARESASPRLPDTYIRTRPYDDDNAPVRARPLSTKNKELPFSTDTNAWLLSESAAHQVLCHDLESVLSRHFVEKYYDLILLPNCHPEFYHGWITEIQHLMIRHKSLQYSVLACAASHLHFIDASSQMQELALTYYSHAIRGLSEILASASQIENHNGLLMSVILLYLHGCMGRGTYADIPRHVNAAIRILRLRLLDHDRPLSISRPFDRLAVESVLYQIFLVTMGSWSDPIELDYHFDAEFWLQAENLLARSTLFPGRSIVSNSPVLGIPLALFKLVLSIKQLYQSPVFRRDRETLDHLKTELEEWEGLVLCNQDLDSLWEHEQERLDNADYSLYKDAAYLYVLIASMLVEQLSEDDETSYTGPPQAVPRDKWQIRKATRILRGHQHDDEWARCFIGNWPVYTLGFLVGSAEDVKLVRDDVWRRWEFTKFAQLARFGRDLENTWIRRGYRRSDG
ncbi:uncharacterized protein Z518_01507 [Rhinocladiella mackenziei CBS 650.93]|uniref:Rhinocladiella mackenziei CBS 650.93 unplaced genomic scaffold supercont1.1, whole genome shotgun sequence n=1 Tax=Rhinocladiella mackenziei CBS 650.93 TaxID=1442369 RepID=A0A0D2JLS7_9EURO|nr:uncharacterized protein Z518_01507 [Rhinocladiella mackenziei CBS 650.93]KIX10425.1 hypothetical protein Z518_01507 [Rhinocladiella mackenziei CBS 650.93]